MRAFTWVNLGWLHGLAGSNVHASAASWRACSFRRSYCRRWCSRCFSRWCRVRCPTKQRGAAAAERLLFFHPRSRPSPPTRAAAPPRRSGLGLLSLRPPKNPEAKNEKPSPHFSFFTRRLPHRFFVPRWAAFCRFHKNLSCTVTVRCQRCVITLIASWEPVSRAACSRCPSAILK